MIFIRAANVSPEIIYTRVLNTGGKGVAEAQLEAMVNNSSHRGGSHWVVCQSGELLAQSHLAASETPGSPASHKR